MIVNVYAVIVAFLSVIRLVVAALVVGLGAPAWRSKRQGLPSDESENRFYLLFLLAGLLVVVNVLSWPVFYLLLQSYVREWPGVMCVWGVTQIGRNSIGLSGWLPPLVAFVQAMKPAVVFASGAWFVLYLATRSTKTGARRNRVVAALLATALLAFVDAAAEGAYLVIPKKEKTLSTGCCTVPFDERPLLERVFAVTGAPTENSVWTAYYAANALVIVATGLASRRTNDAAAGSIHLGLLFAIACAATLVSGFFLVQIAAPRMLNLPGHHCPYDLIPRVPESIVAIAMHVAAAFCVGWAWLAQRLGHCDESASSLPAMTGTMLECAAYGYFGSALMLALIMVLV